MNPVREVSAERVAQVVRELCMEICYRVPPEMVELMGRAREREESPLGRQILDRLIENQAIAAEGEYPYCQDTGYTVAFVDLGQDVHVVGGDLSAAIDRGVADGYSDGYLRGSIVADPLFDRKNTGDNTPAFVHVRVVPGDEIRIQIDAKGAGSENMSRLAMLKPADGIDGVKAFVLRAVAESGPNACPPGIIGVGVGGNFESCALLAKRALMRKVGQPHQDPRIAELEAELFEGCNALGLGPEALGGTQTVLAVHVETMATHIASLPVAVNIECHAHRTGVRVI
ncbi:MAG TPA: fumarate hydratase [Actinomycetota bacterium]|nr:fumarate hydratase [Actinomycetota bacterium]